MPPNVPELQTLVERARGGDDAAASELVRVFGPVVRRVVRDRLPQVMRSKFDSVDFVQSVWGDFFRQLRGGELDFESAPQLTRFLELAAQAKVANEYRKRMRSKKYNLRKEVSLEQGNEEVEPLSHDPTASQEASAKERLEVILHGRPETHKKVLRLRGEGYTFAEIAARLGIDERSARRIVHGVEKELGLNDARQ